MSPFWLFIGPLGLLLQAFLLFTLWKKAAYKSHPFLFAYVAAVFISGLSDWATVMNIPLHPKAGEESYRLYYWSNDAIHQFLTFNIMLSLIYQALEGVPRRAFVIAGIVVMILVVTVVSVYSNNLATISLTRLMTTVDRNLSFGSALLNMVLWSTILRRHIGNIHLLMISAGLGLLTTGKAIGHALRSMARNAVSTGDVIIVFTHLACLVVWWRAFQYAPKTAAELPSASSGKQTSAAGQ